MQNFLQRIEEFNLKYRLVKSHYPLLPTANELRDFKSILQEELDELDDIIRDREALESLPADEPYHAEYLRLLTDLTDWHGDMIVYPHTHGHKFALPIGEILDVIMDSNMSKLGADGEPIYDERGKLLKGPDYWKPEAKILKILVDKIMKANDEIKAGNSETVGS